MSFVFLQQVKSIVSFVRTASFHFTLSSINTYSTVKRCAFTIKKESQYAHRDYGKAHRDYGFAIVPMYYIVFIIHRDAGKCRRLDVWCRQSLR